MHREFFGIRSKDFSTHMQRIYLHVQNFLLTDFNAIHEYVYMNRKLRLKGPSKTNMTKFPY